MSTISVAQKKAIHLSILIILLFIGAGMVFYFFIIYFPGLLHQHMNDITLANAYFTENFYPRLLRIEKRFLLLPAGIFMITVIGVKKNVPLAPSSWWSRFFLLLCWVLLFISASCDGIALGYLNNWNENALPGQVPGSGTMFMLSCVCFKIAGISAGLALTSILAAGTVAFFYQINFSDAGDWVTEYVNWPGV